VFDPYDVQTVSMSEQTMRASFLGMLAALLGAMEVAGITILLIMMLLLGNTVAMGVRERTQEYGVLRALGFRPSHVVAFVLGEAAALGVAGGVLGVAIAVPLINVAVGGFIDMNYAGAFPHFRVPSLDVVGVLLLSMLLAAASAAIPARQAYKLRVVDALRNLG
jgi:putative ABC transport system permease protein